MIRLVFAIFGLQNRELYESMKADFDSCKTRRHGLARSATILPGFFWTAESMAATTGQGALPLQQTIYGKRWMPDGKILPNPFQSFLHYATLIKFDLAILAVRYDLFYHQVSLASLTRPSISRRLILWCIIWSNIWEVGQEYIVRCVRIDWRIIKHNRELEHINLGESPSK